MILESKHTVKHTIEEFYVITDPDDGVRASLRNVGIWFNIDAADRLRKFYNIHAP
jgi:hypothetical protein